MDITVDYYVAPQALTAAEVSAANAAASAEAAASSAAAAAISNDTCSTNATNAANSAAAAAESTAIAVAAAGFQFVFDNQTTMADPGAGVVRFNNATIASVTAIAIDNLSADTGNPDVSPWVLTFDDSTNTATAKGLLRFRKVGDAAVYVDFSVTGLTDNDVWMQLSVSHVGSSGSIVDGDVLVTNFSRSGNDGQNGAGVPVGGADGDMLIKLSSGDYQTAWTAPPVQRIASGSSYSYRFGTAFSILDPATYGSWVFDGTDGYPNKLGVTGTKPVAEPSWGARTNDTYVAGSADVAAILAGYDNVNNALAGMIAAQHSLLAAGADHASIWGGSLHTILDDTDYSTIIGGTNNRIEGRGRYAAIIGGDLCTIQTGASDSESGFRSVILGGTGCIAGGRNGTIIASAACEVQSTYGVVLSGENVTLNNGTHMLAAGNGITMGTTAAGTYSVAFGLNIVVNGTRASAFGDNHVIGSGHDYSSARGSGGVTPFAGAHVFASRHRGAVAGRNQAVDFQCSQETTDTTVTRLSGYGSSGFPTQPDNSIVNGIALVTGVSDAGVCSCFEIDFVSERIGSGTPTLRQNATTVKYDGLALPTDPTMNVTSGGIYRVQVVGLAATNIRWNARVMAEQTVFA